MAQFRNVSHYNSLLRFISSRLSKFKGHFPEVVILSNLLSSLFFDCPETTDLADDPFWIFVGSKRGRRAESRLETKMTRGFHSNRGNVDGLVEPSSFARSREKAKNYSCVTLARQKPREIRLSHLLLSLLIASNASSFSSRMTRNCAAFFFFWLDGLVRWTFCNRVNWREGLIGSWVIN